MAELGPETLRGLPDKAGDIDEGVSITNLWTGIEVHAAAWEAERVEEKNKLALMTAERDALWSELRGWIGEADSGDG